MQKLFFVLALLFFLAGCASPEGGNTPVSATVPNLAATDAGSQVAPPRNLATPLIGAVVVLPVPGKASLSLRSQPNPRASVVGEAKFGDAGKLLGVNAAGNWMLVEIKQQTGWAPVQYLDYTIAQ